MNTLNERREGEEDRRGAEERPALAPLGNGKARVALIVIGGLVNFAVTVGGASWVSGREVDKKVAVIEERQGNQYGEVMRKLDEQKQDINRLLNMLIEERGRR